MGSSDTTEHSDNFGEWLHEDLFSYTSHQHYHSMSPTACVCKENLKTPMNQFCSGNTTIKMEAENERGTEVEQDCSTCVSQKGKELTG